MDVSLCFFSHRRSFLANAQIWTTEVEWLTKKVLFIAFAAADCERGERKKEASVRNIFECCLTRKVFALQNGINYQSEIYLHYHRSV